MIRPGSPEASILTWLADHERATVAEVGSACNIAVASVRGRLNYLERVGLLSGVLIDGSSRRKAYEVTDEGRKQGCT